MKDAHDSITLSIPAAADYIDVVRLTLYGIASRLGYSYEDIEDMKVAVSEACNNAVLHAYSDGQRGKIDIRFNMIDNGLSICVRDEGKSFNFEEKKNKAASLHNKPLNDIHAGGLGIYMMQALMDDVQVNSADGTEVILTKLLHRSERMV